MSDMKYADLLPRHIPSELYRVDYPGSRTVYHAGDGLKAADPSTDFIDKPLSALKAAVTNSFTWQCREPSSFINLFTDRKHAESWALTEPWHNTQTVTWRLFVIDANKLPTLDLLSLRDLVEKLNVKIPEAAGQHREGAFICLHRIPQSAIRETVTAREIIAQRSCMLARSLIGSR